MLSTNGRADNWSGGYLHPFTQIDTENDWTKSQHFLGPVTIGATNPVAGALAANALYAGGPIATVNNVATVGPGVPGLVAKVDLTAQAASIGSTLLYAVPASGAGMYRFDCYVVLTQAATTSSTLPQCQILWNDNDTNSSESQNVTLTSGTNTVGLTGLMSTTVNPAGVYEVKASTNVNYAVNGYASTGATPMQYAIHIKLEYLGQ